MNKTLKTTLTAGIVTLLALATLASPALAATNPAVRETDIAPIELKMEGFNCYERSDGGLLCVSSDMTRRFDSQDEGATWTESDGPAEILPEIVGMRPITYDAESDCFIACDYAGKAETGAPVIVKVFQNGKIERMELPLLQRDGKDGYDPAITRIVKMPGNILRIDYVCREGGDQDPYTEYCGLFDAKTGEHYYDLPVDVSSELLVAEEALYVLTGGGSVYTLELTGEMPMELVCELPNANFLSQCAVADREAGINAFVGGVLYHIESGKPPQTLLSGEGLLINDQNAKCYQLLQPGDNFIFATLNKTGNHLIQYAS